MSDVGRATTKILTAYLKKADRPPLDVATMVGLVRSVSAATNALAATSTSIAAAPRDALTVVTIRRSIRPGALISFEDAKPYKRLTRHLAAKGLSPAQYRLKWGLPDDYPMICAEYAAKCSSVRRRASPSPIAKTLQRAGAPS